MSVDPNEYDVGELRAIAGVDEDTDDAAESDAGTTDAVDATPDAGQATSEESDAVDAAPDGPSVDTAGVEGEDTGESGPWETVPSVDDEEPADDTGDDDPWVSVPDVDDGTTTDDGPAPTTGDTTPSEEPVTATEADDSLAPTETSTEDVTTETTAAASADTASGPAADGADGESSAGSDDGGSNPFTVDLEPSDPDETEEPEPTDETKGSMEPVETDDSGADEPEPTDESMESVETDESGPDGVPKTRSDDALPPDDAGAEHTGDDEETQEHAVTVDGDAEDASPESAGGTSVEDPLTALIEGEETSATGESTESGADATPDSTASPDRIDGPSGEPGEDTRTEIAAALTATRRGATRRITRDQPTGPGDGTAPPEDGLLDGVPTDEQVTVDGADPDDHETDEEWTVETSTEAVAALYTGPDGDTGTVEVDDERAPEEDTETADEDDLSKARAIDFGFEEDDEDAQSRRLSEQVADVLYAGEDAPE